LPWYDDTPDDLDCAEGEFAFRAHPPFIENRLDSILAQTWNGSGWNDVSRYELGYKWVNSWPFMPYGGGINDLLWLDTIRQVRLVGTGPDIALQPVDFDSVPLDNRFDYHRFLAGSCDAGSCSDGDFTPRLNFPRISSIACGVPILVHWG
jgi:hypothetical protein